MLPRQRKAWVSPNEGVALFSDPIHGYVSFTVPYRPGRNETTEKDLIDSPWVQRLRQIFQLQSARWVYPSAEHTRFQHSIGAMHVAGRFATHLYPSLQSVFPDSPSPFYVEELLRVAALLHDVGHGPFCHFFDDNFLDEFLLTHEGIGQRIVEEEMGDLIQEIRRSPSGYFSEEERLDPRYVAFLIGKGSCDREQFPRWLSVLHPLFNGIYTADNLDYVLRDSYMCGVAVGPVDLERLIYYSFFTEQGLTLHKAGLSALTMFLNARWYLYTNVYYHRTTRAIDLHLREIFRKTIKLLFPGNPLDNLKGYLTLTDWSLCEEVRRWAVSCDGEQGQLASEWRRILSRDVKWRMAYSTTIAVPGFERGRRMIRAEELEERIRQRLPHEKRRLPFRVDAASQDPRPFNPLTMGERQIYVFDPSTRRVSTEILKEFLEYMPAKVVLLRVFSLNDEDDLLLSEVVEGLLREEEPSVKTNV